MSSKELEKLNIIQQVTKHQITQVKAVELLDISDRQVRNLLKMYIINGPSALISKKRGKKSNRSLCQQLEKVIISIISENYSDFGPTLAQEKLKQNHNIKGKLSMNPVGVHRKFTIIFSINFKRYNLICGKTQLKY